MCAKDFVYRTVIGDIIICIAPCRIGLDGGWPFHPCKSIGQPLRTLLCLPSTCETCVDLGAQSPSAAPSCCQLGRGGATARDEDRHAQAELLPNLGPDLCGCLLATSGGLPKRSPGLRHGQCANRQVSVLTSQCVAPWVRSEVIFFMPPSQFVAEQTLMLSPDMAGPTQRIASSWDCSSSDSGPTTRSLLSASITPLPLGLDCEAWPNCVGSMQFRHSRPSPQLSV